LLLSAGLLDTIEARQEASDGTRIDPSIRRLIGAVDPERISKNLFCLSKDPLPYRKLNLTLPGHQKNTLYEADDYLAGKLKTWGYRVEREGVQVQAFRRDTNKPKHAQYSGPKPEDPWSTIWRSTLSRRGRHPGNVRHQERRYDSASNVGGSGDDRPRPLSDLPLYWRTVIHDKTANDTRDSIARSEGTGHYLCNGGHHASGDI